jgi:hypothetical protein
MGTVFYEEVNAASFNEAKKIASARNPTAKIMTVTAVL